MDKRQRYEPQALSLEKSAQADEPLSRKSPWLHIIRRCRRWMKLWESIYSRRARGRFVTTIARARGNSDRFGHANCVMLHDYSKGLACSLTH